MLKLYDKLGGEPAVDSVVETFYRYVLTDERVSSFFDDTDMDRQIAKQKAFLTMAFGGPVTYSGADMRRAHAPLNAKGLNANHFEAVVEILIKSLKDHGVTDELIGDVIAIAGSTRNDVLGL